ncbi:LEPR-XLL domain-containing protein [Bradyrhizobium guangzhouense]|uniref:LEPR-XLL domain-containing protein n=1 Tax=Bradyrhizobium guangzhouense TaxID=1325095 RepID=UPI001009A171|nr:LEPR-XLL domain-containing protein [Bradyrhizobium guangzhouense]RXH10117.1 LEPR-XLL domain-containing protein [Bradyrhizobium guangzhouense]
MFFEKRSRPKFGSEKSRRQSMSHVRRVLTGSRHSEKHSKDSKNELMASASRRILFEAVEPRVMLSADLAPTAMVLAPDPRTSSLIIFPQVVPLYTVAGEVAVAPDAPAAHVTTPQSVAPVAGTDVVAASFPLQVERAGNAAGSYQFTLPGPASATATHVVESPGFMRGNSSRNIDKRSRLQTLSVLNQRPRKCIAARWPILDFWACCEIGAKLIRCLSRCERDSLYSISSLAHTQISLATCRGMRGHNAIV